MHSFINPVIEAMVGLASLLSVFFIAWGGLMYITSSGDPQKLIRAKRLIIRSLIGLVIVIGASAVSLILNHAYGPVVTSSAQQLPQLSTIKPDPTSSSLIGVLLKAITGIFDVIVKSAAKPFIAALNYFTKATPLLTSNSSVMHLWVICTSIADGLMVLVLALIGFHVMGAEQFGLRDVNLQSLLPQILFTFVLMNTSIYLLDGIIELSNAMINALRAGTGNVTPWTSLYKLVSSTSDYSFVALIILVIFLIFTVILLIYYIGRIVALYLGAVLSPLIVLMWLVPSFRDFAENALKAYMATVFVLFIHVIILSLAGSLFLEVASGSKGSGDPIMPLLLGLATLVALIKTQGVLMQLNYASLGPKTARRLGGSFVNGISYLAISARSNFAGTLAPVSGSVSSGIKRLIPEAKAQQIGSASNKTSMGSKNNMGKS